MLGKNFTTMISKTFLYTKIRKATGGTWKIIDNFWRIRNSPESPDITTRSNSPLPDSTPTPSTLKVAEVSIIASSSLETPPVSLCFAPKKRKLDINFY